MREELAALVSKDNAVEYGGNFLCVANFAGNPSFEVYIYTLYLRLVDGNTATLVHTLAYCDVKLINPNNK